jgi:hypothetical protein
MPPGPSISAHGLIPPGSPTFHLLLAVHIAAALRCLATGAIAALSPKRPGRHPASEPSATAP